MSRTSNPRIRQVWQTRIDDQPNSGLSIARFCDQQGCSEASFYHWKRRLAQAPQGDQVVELNLPGGVIAIIPLDPMIALELILRYSAPLTKE